MAQRLIALATILENPGLVPRTYMQLPMTPQWFGECFGDLIPSCWPLWAWGMCMVHQHTYMKNNLEYLKTKAMETDLKMVVSWWCTC